MKGAELHILHPIRLPAPCSRQGFRQLMNESEVHSHQQGSGKDWIPGKMISEKRGRRRNHEFRLSPLAGHFLLPLIGKLGNSGKNATLGPFSRKQIVARLDRIGIVKIGHRNHGTETVVKSHDRLAIDQGNSIVLHRLFIRFREISLKTQGLPWENISQKLHSSGDPGDGTKLEIDGPHRGHRRTLSDGLGNQRGSKGTDRLRDLVFADDSRADSVCRDLVGKDAIHEGKGTKMVAHRVGQKETRLRQGLSPWRSLEKQESNYAFCSRMTILQKVSVVKSLGISADFIGLEKRSAGTSVI
jgi:hypothetical protein